MKRRGILTQLGFLLSLAFLGLSCGLEQTYGPCPGSCDGDIPGRVDSFGRASRKRGATIGGSLRPGPPIGVPSSFEQNRQ